MMEEKPSKQRRSKANDEEFDVGYKKPPKTTRFKQGKSGNPKGRPKGSRNLLILINEELDKEVMLQENGRSLKLSKREVVVKRLVNQALSGEARAIGTLIGMDKDSKDSEDKVVELTPEDLEQFMRFKERTAEAMLKKMSKTNQAVEEKSK